MSDYPPTRSGTRHTEEELRAFFSKQYGHADQAHIERWVNDYLKRTEHLKNEHLKLEIRLALDGREAMKEEKDG